jgi:hypothetical protein
MSRDDLAYHARWKHVKTGNVYRVHCVATIEATMTPSVVYEREDHTPGRWVRPQSEFLDGRFERLKDKRSCGCYYDETCICDDPDFK